MPRLQRTYDHRLVRLVQETGDLDRRDRPRRAPLDGRGLAAQGPAGRHVDADVRGDGAGPAEPPGAGGGTTPPVHRSPARPARRRTDRAAGPHPPSGPPRLRQDAPAARGRPVPWRGPSAAAAPAHRPVALETGGMASRRAVLRPRGSLLVPPLLAARAHAARRSRRSATW